MTSCIFGPVPSRRLGRSLGIDLVPFKTCTYDCIYCQLGRTTEKIIERREWLPLQKVLNELKSKLHTKPNYLTFSGSGEPTLYSRLAELISRIKEMTDTPIAVLTNGSLLWQGEVRNELIGADLVIPSLDAGCASTFQQVNRPHPDISFEKFLKGMIEFRQQFKGQYWLEVFLLDGISTTAEEIENLARCIEQINPDRVQLNTVTRPAAETFARTVAKEQIEAIAARFGSRAEVLASYKSLHEAKEFQAQGDDILEMLRRRPCSIEEITDVFGLHRNEVLKYIEQFTTLGEVIAQVEGPTMYYKAAERKMPIQKATGEKT